MKSIPLLNFPRAYCTIPLYNQRHISHPQVKKIFENYFPKTDSSPKKHATISCSLVYKFFRAKFQLLTHASDH